MELWLDLRVLYLSFSSLSISLPARLSVTYLRPSPFRASSRLSRGDAVPGTGTDADSTDRALSKIPMASSFLHRWEERGGDGRWGGKGVDEGERGGDGRGGGKEMGEGERRRWVRRREGDGKGGEKEMGDGRWGEKRKKRR